MIRSKTSKRIAVMVSMLAFVGLTSVSSAQDAVAFSSKDALAILDIDVSNAVPASSSTNVVAKTADVNTVKTPLKSVQKSATNQSEKLSKTRELQSGVASYYGPGFHGRRTANGETFNMNALTAAHRTLPFGTKLKVTNLNNGQSAIVRVNDRGPYVGGRIIDLSVAAAKQIGSTQSGTARVKLEVVEQ